MVASDRISAFDYILTPTIPDKGAHPHRDDRVVVRPAGRLVANHFESVDDPVIPAAVARPGDGVPAARHGAGRGGRPRLPRRLGAARLPGDRRGVRRRAAGRAASTATGCPSRSSPRPPRPRSASTTRTSPTTRWSRRSAPRPRPNAARADPGHLHRRRRARRRRGASSWPTPSSSSAAIAPRAAGAGRRGAHAGLVAVLAGRRLACRAAAAELRQAVRPQLAAVRRVRLGPAGRRRAAAAARRGRRARPGRATSRPTSG